jgi:hypothetical protein
MPLLTLENMLRGSGDIGAMISNAFGLRQIDKETNRCDARMEVKASVSSVLE